MAHSLPVVATAVGSIPAYSEGAVELVPPKNRRPVGGRHLPRKYINRPCDRC